MPVYNRAGFVSKSIESILRQDYVHWECIIVDDGSTDGTQREIENFSEKHPNILLFSRPETKKKGASSCRNYGLQKARGELIQFLDSDDLLSENKLSEQLKYYIPNSLKIITCKWGGFKKDGDFSKLFKYKYRSYKSFKKGIYLLNSFGKHNEFFPLHVYLTSRSLIEKSGGWNENLTNNDDAEFFSRVILSSSGINFASKGAVYYRYHSEPNLSSINSREKVLSAIQSWKLIEYHIHSHYPFNNLKYVNNAKKALYDRFYQSYPEVFEESIDFFKNKKCYKSLFYQMRKKLSI